MPIAADGETGFWYTVVHSGWFAAVIATTWAAILRTALGSYKDFQKESKADRQRMNDFLQALQDNQSKLSDRLWHLEERQRMEERKK